MDNPTALEKARALCPYHALHERLAMLIGSDPCPRCSKITAALKRAYADGIQWAAEHWATPLADEVQRIQKEADQLEGK